MQWNNTNDLLIWFNGSFDIDSYYPSITEELLRKAIEHASKYTPISDDEKEVLFHTCKSLLYYKGEAWRKKGTSLFDITMGGYPGAEKCDIVGLYLLSRIKHLKMESGVFRDDGRVKSYRRNPQAVYKAKQHITLCGHQKQPP